MRRIFALKILKFFGYRYVTIYQRQQKKAREDAQAYLSNPINAYTLVKRLTADWTQVEALVNTNINAGWFFYMQDNYRYKVFVKVFYFLVVASVLNV